MVEAVPEQPEAVAVPVTVYVTLLNGPAVTMAVLVADNPVAGVHAYVLAPLAESVCVRPEEIVILVGAIATVGNNLTVAVTVLLVKSVPLKVAALL